MEVEEVRKKLKSLEDRERALLLQRYFKTGPGEYGEGDIFLGIPVPELRKIAKRSVSLSRRGVRNLLTSPLHEERLVALLLLIARFRQGDEGERERIYTFYLNHTRFINNWDLVDLSAGKIIGAFLFDRGRETLYELARSPSLWERRIAIMATSFFIRENDFTDTLKLAALLLLHDEEELLHKAVGWMLREVGNRHMAAEERFLKQHYRAMPRTMLRYAMEKFPEVRRQGYLKGTL